MLFIMKHQDTALMREPVGPINVRRAALALGASLALAGCASNTPRLSVDRAEEPLACTGIGWLEADRPASLAEQRLRGEILRELAGKGYAVDVESPDCVVSGVIYTGSRPGSPVSVGLGAGRWGGTFGTSVGVSVPVGGGARVVGNLGIDVIDLRRNAEVWRGTLEAAFRTPEPTSDEVGAAVRTVLAEFPPRR